MLSAVTLAGCDSGGDDPVVSPTPTASSTSASPSASSSPSPTPSSTGPDIPAAARQKTNAGAEAFVRFFFDQFNVAWTQPQPGLIKALSDPACQFCAKAESTAQYLNAHAQRYQSVPSTLLTVDVFGGAPTGQQFTEIHLVQNAAKIVDSAGKVVDTDPRLDKRYYVTLKWAGDGWRLLELEKTK
ncbi:MAG: hypothetical protein IE926_09885 [Micrococcales bacterium]|nr:hypothetical protein [Micrococcales bacterium]